MDTLPPPAKLNVGFHVSKSIDLCGDKRQTTYKQAILDDITKCAPNSTMAISYVQIFAAGPQSFKPTISMQEADEIGGLCSVESQSTKHTAQFPKVLIHGSYLDNPWSNNTLAIHNIRKELDIARRLQGPGVVIHLNSKAGANTQVVDSLVSDLANNPTHCARPMLWLEVNAARSTPQTFETPSKLNALLEKISPRALPHIGLCIDTAHLHSCGVSFTTEAAVYSWFEEYFTLAHTKDIPTIIHLNDSATPLGSGRDTHELLGKGAIWGIDTSGLAALLEICRLGGFPVILERAVGTMPDGDSLTADHNRVISCVAHDLKIISGLLKNH